jgi:transposase InsO family protein
MWIDGPAFLWKPQPEWPRNPDTDLRISSEDPEVKGLVNAVIVEETPLLDGLASRTSSWMKLKRTIGWILLFIKNLCTKVEQRKTSMTIKLVNVDNKRVTRQQTQSHSKRKQKESFSYLPITMLQKAEHVLIRHVQRQSFSQEFADLSHTEEKESHVKRSSHMYKLDPYVHEGIIRVGGRLQHSSLSFDAKHQILLPHKSCVSRLILQDIHQAIGHQGKNAILAELRQRYWIPHASQIIKQIVSKCVSCRRYRAQPEEQKMADLPRDRIVPGKPFSDVGIDYFGPFMIKRGRSEVKRYGVIFSCCKSRAVHLEVACSLTTDSCINAIRRFVARRGPIECIRSDNGTNLVGAEQEMRKEIQQWNQSKVGRALQQHNIEWKFNPPAGSHFGGFWERLIRSVRKIFYSLLRDQSIHLDDEGLQTLMCEVEAILNNRPLTSASEDPNDLGTLSPSHILMMKPSGSMSPGIFEIEDNYTRRRWRQLQYLSNLFWKRWTREYLPLLQKRQKWVRPKRNVAVGDIVLVTDNSPRNVWPMARVTEIHHDYKGLVRVVTLKTKSTTLQRPVDKLCILLEADD